MTAYYVRAGTAGNDSGSSWANAAESVNAVVAAVTVGSGDIFYVHNTHAANVGGAITWTFPEGSTAGAVLVLCVDGGDAAWSNPAAMGTTVGTLTTGASETTGGNTAFTINASSSGDARAFIHGITIQAGAGASSSSADIIVGGAPFQQIEFAHCTLHTNSTSGLALITLGGTAGNFGNRFIFTNCTFTFGATGQALNVTGGRKTFVNCTTAGTAPTTLFVPTALCKAVVECFSCDWSASTNVVSQALTGLLTYAMHNCVIATPVTGTSTNTCEAEFMACDAVNANPGAGTANILNYYRENFFGVVEDDQDVYLTTGGAQGEQDDGTDTSYSLKMSPSAAVTQYFPLYTPWISVFVPSTGSKTVALKIATTRASALNKGEVWMEVEYMGEPGATGTTRVANSPHSQVEVDDDCPIVSGTIHRDPTATGTGRTDTSEAWTGVTETETNTLTATVSCDSIGYIRCRVGLGLYAAGATNPIYVDPKISVS